MMRIFRVALPMIVKRSVALVAGTSPTIPDQKVDTVGGDKIIDPCTGRIAVLKQATATAHGSPTPTVAEGVEALAICVAWINVLHCVSVTVGAVPLPTPTHKIMELPGLVANNPANRLATDPVLTLLALRMMEGVGGRTTVWASKSIVPMKSSRNAHRIIFQVIHGPKLAIPSKSCSLHHQRWQQSLG